MEEVWWYLNRLYRRCNMLNMDKPSYIYNVKVSLEAMTMRIQFMELHACWEHVYINPETIKAMVNLDSPNADNIFIVKLTYLCQEC